MCYKPTSTKSRWNNLNKTLIFHLHRSSPQKAVLKHVCMMWRMLHTLTTQSVVVNNSLFVGICRQTFAFKEGVSLEHPSIAPCFSLCANIKIEPITSFTVLLSFYNANINILKQILLICTYRLFKFAPAWMLKPNISITYNPGGCFMSVCLEPSSGYWWCIQVLILLWQLQMSAVVLFVSPWYLL